jgi:hypothetical protein
MEYYTPDDLAEIDNDVSTSSYPLDSSDDLSGSYSGLYISDDVETNAKTISSLSDSTDSSLVINQQIEYREVVNKILFVDEDKYISEHIKYIIIVSILTVTVSLCNNPIGKKVYVKNQSEGKIYHVIKSDKFINGYNIYHLRPDESVMLLSTERGWVSFKN